MQRARTDPLTSGEQLEARLALVWFWEGYYTRSGVDLTHHFGSEMIQVTDLDLLAFSFGPGLESRLVIGEAKSGTGRSAPKPLDRIVWLNGLQHLVGADSAELTINSGAVQKSRDVGRRLNVAVQSIDDLTARAVAINVLEVNNVGAHGEAAAQLRKSVAKTVRDHVILQPLYRFLSSQVWFLDEFAAFKQCVGALSSLSALWTPGNQDDEAVAARWLIGEALSVLVFNLSRIASHARPLDAAAFANLVKERLADGVLPAAKMRVLSRDVDRYISGLLNAVRAPQTLRVEAIGAFEPEAPDWADSVIELAQRVRAMPDARELARRFDVVAHERIARGRRIPDAAVVRLALDGRSLSGLIGAVAAFLRNLDALPKDLSDALIAPVGLEVARATTGSSISGSGEALFDVD